MESATVALGTLIKSARVRRGWSQARVCEEVGLSEPLLSGIEQGKKVPSLPVLARLYNKLGDHGDDRSRQDELALWLAVWVPALAAAPDSAKIADLGPALQDLLAGSADRLVSAVRRRAPRPAHSRPSLADLADFGPFIAVCADRREPEPKSIADLFILSGAISDLTWLPRAPEGVVTAVRTDKWMVQLPPASLIEEVGRRNLLVVAGPNTNWAARVLNPSSLWRFQVEAGWEEWDRRMRTHADLRRRSVLAAVAAVLSSATLGPKRQRLELDESALAKQRRIGVEAVGRARTLAESLLRGPDGLLHTPKEIIGKFQTGGLVDPIEQVVHDVLPSADTDLATISLAVHPWAQQEGLVAVVVAGIGGPGTTEALRVLLEEPHAFDHRPFGGVIEVQLPAFEDWASRFREPTWAWVTSPYEPGDLVDRIDNEPAKRLVETLLSVP